MRRGHDDERRRRLGETTAVRPCDTRTFVVRTAVVMEKKKNWKKDDTSGAEVSVFKCDRPRPTNDTPAGTMGPGQSFARG